MRRAEGSQWWDVYDTREDRFLVKRKEDAELACSALNAAERGRDAQAIVARWLRWHEGETTDNIDTIIADARKLCAGGGE